MLTLFLALLSTPLHAGTPVPIGSASQWIGFGDYPADALKAKQSGAVSVALRISPAGEVTGCTVTRSSGSSSLDRTTCALLFIRAHFTPAVDDTGKAIESAFASTVRWTYPTTTGAATREPVTLSDLSRYGVLSSVLHVDGDGIISTCEPKPSPYANIPDNPDLCAIFPVGVRYAPPALFKGRPAKRKITLDLTVDDRNVR